MPSTYTAYAAHHFEFNKLIEGEARWAVLNKVFAVLLGFVLPLSTSLTHVMLIGLLITWFLGGHLKEKFQYIYRHPIAQLAVGFYALFVLGCSYSVGPMWEAQLLLWKMSKLLYIPFLLPILREPKWRTLALGAFLAAMILTLFLALLKVYGGVPITSRYTTACVFKNHIDTNLMMAFAAFFIGQILMLRQGIYFRCFGIVLLGLMSFYILGMSDGRTGYIIFAMLWILFFLQHFSKKQMIFGILGLCILLIMAGSQSTRFQIRAQSAFNELVQYQLGDKDTSAGERLQYITETWKLVKNRPWLGYGTGSFKSVYQDHTNRWQLKSTDNPHNEYMNVFLQLGIIGLSGLFALFVGMIMLSFKLPRLERNLVQGVIIAILIGSLANSWLMDFTPGYFFAFLTAACFSALQIRKTS